VKYNKPTGDKWESRILFKTSVFVVVPHQGHLLPQIFGFELNEVDKCPLCGKKLEKNLMSRISGGDDSDAVRWPWHSTVYQIKHGSFSYICGGTLVQSKAVLTSGEFTSFCSNLHHRTFFFLQQTASLRRERKSAKTLCKLASESLSC
jgi:hypothetical protein